MYTGEYFVPPVNSLLKEKCIEWLILTDWHAQARELERMTQQINAKKDIDLTQVISRLQQFAKKYQTNNKYDALLRTAKYVLVTLTTLINILMIYMHDLCILCIH